MTWTFATLARIRHSSRREIVVAGIILLVALAIAAFNVATLLGVTSWADLWQAIQGLFIPHHPVTPLPCEGDCWRC